MESHVHIMPRGTRKRQSRAERGLFPARRQGPHVLNCQGFITWHA
jgi:hypothetical protein